MPQHHPPSLSPLPTRHSSTEAIANISGHIDIHFGSSNNSNTNFPTILSLSVLKTTQSPYFERQHGIVSYSEISIVLSVWMPFSLILCQNIYILNQNINKMAVCNTGMKITHIKATNKENAVAQRPVKRNHECCKQVSNTTLLPAGL